MKKVFLVIGTCGTGKTWVMTEFAKHLGISSVYSYATGLYSYLKKDGYIILGKYDGSVFQGSDKLSMAIMTHNEKVRPVFEAARMVVGEGDRFTNSTFIKDFVPTIIKITGDGVAGRAKRGSQQTERHLKSITTRVENITPDWEVADSTECLKLLIDYAEGREK